MYRFARSRDGWQEKFTLGFHREEAAVDFARRLAFGGEVEVWRGEDLVVRFEPEIRQQTTVQLA